MQINLGSLMATIVLISLSRHIFVTCSKHHQCKRVDVLKALKIRDKSAPLSSCTGKLVLNYNPKRIPQTISEIVCPSEMGNRCIQLVLPMDVFISGKEDESLQKIIYVPSGCIDSQHTKKQHKKKPKSDDKRKELNMPKGFRVETASIKISRRRRYVISATD